MPVKKGTTTKNGSKTKNANSTRTQLANLETNWDQGFHMADGRVVTRLGDLPQMIESAEGYIFDHHVNAERNDFSSWIKDVFGQTGLSKKIARTKDKEKMVSTLRSSIN